MTDAPSPSTPPTSLPVSASAGPVPAQLTARDVLLIDDDESVRCVLSEVLKRNGYSFESAGNGRTALALLTRHKFRLVITDIFMPDMDGLEFIMKYTAINRRAPILAISGGGRGSLADTSLKPAQLLGSQRTLAKPFGLKDFIAVVQEMLHEQAA